jgi:hypothetical protein
MMLRGWGMMPNGDVKRSACGGWAFWMARNEFAESDAVAYSVLMTMRLANVLQSHSSTTVHCVEVPNRKHVHHAGLKDVFGTISAENGHSQPVIQNHD